MRTTSGKTLSFGDDPGFNSSTAETVSAQSAKLSRRTISLQSQKLIENRHRPAPVRDDRSAQPQTRDPREAAARGRTIFVPVYGDVDGGVYRIGIDALSAAYEAGESRTACFVTSMNTGQW